MLIKLDDKAVRPDDFFLYAQCNTTLVMYGFTTDPAFAEFETPEIDNVPQKCLPPSFGVYMSHAGIVEILETMKITSMDELNEEIQKLRKHITNDRFPYLAPDGKYYYVLCGEGEHRDLIKGARRKAERDPEYSHTWIMINPADDTPAFVPMPNANLIDLANQWEDWCGVVFELSVMMKMSLTSLRYEQIKNYDVDFTSLTSIP